MASFIWRVCRINPKCEKRLNLCREKLANILSHAPVIRLIPQKPCNTPDAHTDKTAVAPTPGNTMTSQPTKGGGDCAFHAALGAWNTVTGQFETDNIAEKRNSVAAAIRTCRDKSLLFPLVMDAIRELVMSTQVLNGVSLQLLRNAYNQHCEACDSRNEQLRAAIESELSHNPEMRERINQYIAQYIQNKKLDKGRADQLNASLYAQFCIYEAEHHDADEDSFSNLIKTSSFNVIYDAYKKPAPEFPGKNDVEI
jgi:hypothetical protein